MPVGSRLLHDLNLKGPSPYIYFQLGQNYISLNDMEKADQVDEIRPVGEEFIFIPQCHGQIVFGQIQQAVAVSLRKQDFIIRNAEIMTLLSENCGNWPENMPVYKLHGAVFGAGIHQHDLETVGLQTFAAFFDMGLFVFGNDTHGYRRHGGLLLSIYR